MITSETEFRVIFSPHPEDEDLPWIYDLEPFIDWVDEVFCEAKRPDLGPEEALDIIRSLGYRVEVR